ncbi:MAG TPA: hypothetical protein VIG76_10820 [Amnibacterium sp.]|jgi:hypothetical protein|uniref:hypothetical protein n=1 Tax=Amnibacterium sp. TaxID=1872496 RepID=UPI002F92B0A2
METDPELLRAAAATSRLSPAREVRVDDAVPMLRFLVGSCRATVALVRFLVEVARADASDPIRITPRILRSI